MGAGPAGLTAAYELLKRGVPVTILERDPRQVGGLARTVEHNGYRFDIGGHPLFSPKEEGEEVWAENLAEGMLRRGRPPPLPYPGRVFSSPLQAFHPPRDLRP